MNAAAKKKPGRGSRKNKVSKRIDMDALPPAIVDGKLDAIPEDILILRRSWRGDAPISFAHVMSVSAEGYVNLYDDTLGQQFPFQLGGEIAAKLVSDLKVFRRAPRPEQAPAAKVVSRNEATAPPAQATSGSAS